MRQFRTVALVQLRGLLAAVGNSNTRKSRPRSAWLVLGLFAALALYISSAYSFALALELARTGNADLVLMLMPGLGIVFSVLMGSQGAGVFVFAGRDNDLLLSLPIPRVTLALAKLAALLIENAFLMVCMLVPAGVAYSVHVATRAWFWPAILVDAVLLALLSTALSVLFGLVIAWIRNLGHGTAIVNVAGMVALLAIIAGSLAGQVPLLRMLETDPAPARGWLTTWLPMLGWVRDVAVDGSLPALALLAVLTVGPFTLVAWLVGRSFVALVSGAATRRRPRIRADVAAMGARPPFMALLRREGQRFFGSTTYFLNTGVGLAMLLLGSGYLLAVRTLPEPLTLAASVLGVRPPVLLALIAMSVLTTVITTAPSVSLEGRRLWILRAAPLPARTILEAKVAFNLLLVAPALLLFTVAAAVATRPNPSDAALVFTLPLCAAAVFAQIGLLANLVWPNLNAPNDTLVVKQSVSVAVSLFAGFALVGITAAAGLSLTRSLGTASFWLVTAALAVVALALRAVIRGWGVRVFQTLS